MPQLKGSVTPSVAAAATAASTALPPWSRIAIADCVACSLIVAAAPPVPRATGVFACAMGATRRKTSSETRRSRFIRGHRLAVRRIVTRVRAADDGLSDVARSWN